MILQYISLRVDDLSKHCCDSAEHLSITTGTVLMRQSSANWHEALTSDGWTTHFIHRMPASLSLRADHNTNYTQCSPAWLM